MPHSKQTTSLLHDIAILWFYLGKQTQLQLSLFSILMLIAIIAEIISIGAIIPFLTALTSPETLVNSTKLAPIINHLNIQKTEDVLLPFTLLFILVSLVSAFIRITLFWANAKLTISMGTKLRTDLYKRTLFQPYEYHLGKNSSDLVSLLTEKADSVIRNGIMQILLLISSFILSLSIIATLFWINPDVATVTFIILGGGYILTGYIVRKKIKGNSELIAKNQPLTVKYTQESIGGIRDVILNSSQATFKNLFKNAAHHVQYAQAQNIFLGHLPKPILELTAIIMIALLAYLLQHHHSTEALPILGALALGAQRLLPSLQQMYFSWSAASGTQAAIADVVECLTINSSENNHHAFQNNTLSLCDNIELRHVNYSYPDHTRQVLQNVNLTIKKGTRLGFIGETGSGKSTLLDIVMGLLKPTQGEIWIDNQVLNHENINHWRNNIAHVPQSIFLADASVTDNIAFGIPPERVDHERIKIAAQQAQISDYIDSLPKGYNTLVGENGIRLSGGQKQRIGIARALYKQAEVIVFDEATSALDNETEKSVMNAIDSLNSDLTILIIAHRVSTLKNCNTVYQLANGKIETLKDFHSFMGSQ